MKYQKLKTILRNRVGSDISLKIESFSTMRKYNILKEVTNMND